MHIPIAKPKFHQDDLKRIAESLERGWVGMGPHVSEFESRFADYTKAAEAVSCSSGTTALHLALAAADIGPGDEVIVPSFTWVSSVNAIIYQGATPILCDIDLDTYALSPNALEACITPKTRAVMPVHLFGCAAPMDRIMTIAKTYKLMVIEDAACALGTWINGRHAGTVGDFGTFSFHPRKTITTGEGGMVLASSDKQISVLQTLRNHGINTQGVVQALGFNYRLSDVQGALGVGQMELLSEFLNARRKLATRYLHALSDFDMLALPTPPEGTTHSYQAFVCRLKDRPQSDRDQLMSRLAEKGVQTRPGTHAVHTLDWHSTNLGRQNEGLPNATVAHEQTIALPLFPGMTETDQDFVVEQLADCLQML